jgi:hypothetical protein
LSIARFLSPSPIIVAAVAAVLFHLGVEWQVISLPVSVALKFAAMVLIGNYALEILEESARGIADYAVLSFETLTTAGRQRGWLFAGLAVLAGGAETQLSGHVPTWAIYAGAFVSLTALPLAAAGLAVSHRWRLALNPLNWLEIGPKLGSLLLVVVGAAYTAWLVSVLALARHAWWLEFMAGFAWLAASYLIGRCLYARRQALGLVTPRAPEVLAAAEHERTVRARRAAVSHAYGFASRGNFQGALDHLRSYARTEADVLQAELWILREISQWEEPGPALAMGEALASALESAQRPLEAGKVRTLCTTLATRVDRARLPSPG